MNPLTAGPSRDSAEFSQQVNRMFDRVAPRYDALNAIMSAGLHEEWRRRAAAASNARPGDSVLDVCCGTGDLALELARLVGPAGTVLGCDFSEEMLSLAAKKAAGRRVGQVRFEHADALHLPYEDESFAAATVGFALRNLADHQAGVAEMARVVRPGGTVVVLEFTRPLRPPFSTFYDIWFDRLVPLLGRLSKDAAAYSYLPSSVREFTDPRGLAAMLAAAGLAEVRYRILAGGIVTIHSGVRS